MNAVALVIQLVGLIGLIGLGGVLVLWAALWSRSRRDRHLALLAQAGMIALALWALASILLPGFRDGQSLATAVAQPQGMAALGVLAVVSALAGFFTDLTAEDAVGWRAVVALAAVLALVGLAAWVSGPEFALSTQLVIGVALLTAVVWPGTALAASVALRFGATEHDAPPPGLTTRLAVGALLLIAVSTGGLLTLSDRGPLQEVPTVLVISGALGVAAVVLTLIRSLHFEYEGPTDVWGQVNGAPDRWWPIGSRRLW